MKADGALGLLDDAADAVGRLPAWVGLLWFTALPVRFVLAALAIRLVEMGAEAVHHAFWMRRMAFLLLATWLVSLWGRQVFVQACRHAFQSLRPPPASLLRIPPAAMAGHLVAALTVEALFWALLPTLVAPALLILLAPLAAAAAPAGGPGPVDALSALARGIGPVSRLLRLLLLFALVLPIAAVNLHWLCAAIAWLAAGIPGIRIEPWEAVLNPGNPGYAILLFSGALLLLEPFWLAAVTAHVERVRARSTGDDLRRWFAELRAAS
ncbi:MAG TPA: hypothetical protein VFA79_07360 [Myxococcales bacterium]|nr:hypothetical protein [Myxococcales bacterium]